MEFVKGGVLDFDEVCAAIMDAAAPWNDQEAAK